MNRGDVYWADVVPRSGSEQTGRRPVLIVSDDSFNLSRTWQTLNVVPMTSSRSQAKRDTTVEIPRGSAGLTETGFALCHQITTLDKSKLDRRIGSLPPNLLEEVRRGIIVALDLD